MFALYTYLSIFPVIFSSILEMTSVIKTYLQYNKVRSNNENSWVHECINAIVGQKM